jgi:hypothetical protein
MPESKHKSQRTMTSQKTSKFYEERIRAAEFSDLEMNAFINASAE